MELKSLGYRSELIFTAFDGRVDVRDSYVVVRTPEHPGYYWGNFLIFDRPPRPEDRKLWPEIFKSEFPEPQIKHVTLAWDSANAERGAAHLFEEDGFLLEESVALTTMSVHRSPKHDESVVVRKLSGDRDWAECLKLYVDMSSADPKHLKPEQWASFYRQQFVRYRKMCEAGIGSWYGGYIDGELASALGVFHDGKPGGVARYQQVATHPRFARRGACSTLVYEAACDALKHSSNLVMIADPDYHAARIYESVGFKPTEKTVGVYWWEGKA